MAVKKDKTRLSTVLIIILITSLTLLWIGAVGYGGEEFSVVTSRIVYHGVDVDAGETVKLAVRSGDVPITIFIINEAQAEEWARGNSWEYMDEMNLGPNQRMIVEFEAMNEGSWGVFIKGPRLERAEYKIQFLDPMEFGHIRYTWVPIIPLICLSLLLMVVDYTLYCSKKIAELHIY